MTRPAATATVTNHGPRVRYQLDELPDGIHPVTTNAAIEVVSLHPGEGHELGASHVDRWLVTIAGKGTFSTVRGEHSLDPGVVAFVPAEHPAELDALEVDDGEPLRVAVLTTGTALAAAGTDLGPVDDWAGYD